MTTEYRVTLSVHKIHKENVIVERVHQTVGNFIHTFNIQQMDFDNENPWEGVLSSTMVSIYGAHYYTAYTVRTGIISIVKLIGN